MAAFDEQLAALQAQLGAATRVLGEHPEVAAKVSVAMAAAHPDAVAVEEAAQDAARANALARALEAARAALPKPDPVKVAAVQKKPSVKRQRGAAVTDEPAAGSVPDSRVAKKPDKARG